MSAGGTFSQLLEQGKKREVLSGRIGNKGPGDGAVRHARHPCC